MGQLTKLDFDVQSSIIINGIPISFSSGSATATWVYSTSSFRIGKIPPADLSALGTYAYTNQPKLVSEGEYIAISNGSGSYALMQIVDSQSLNHGSAKNGVEFDTTTVAFTAPTITAFSPADELIGVRIGQSITLAFSEAIQKGSGVLILRDSSGSVVETYDVSKSGNISISGSLVTIDPSSNLKYGTGYTLELPSGSFKDLGGEPYSGSSNYNFTTETDPNSLITITSLNFDIQSQVIIKEVPLQFSAGSDTSTWIYGQATARVGTVAPVDLSTLDRLKYTNEAKLVTEGEYVAVRNGFGNYVLLHISDSKSMNHGSTINGVTFTSSSTFIAPPDTTSPTILTLSPRSSSVGVAVNSDIVATFSEEIQRGLGKIIIKDDAGNLFLSFDASSADLKISGNTLTINPEADLNYSTRYSVEFTPGALKDLAGNSFSGVSSHFFTTAPRISSPPIAVTGTPGADMFVSPAGDMFVDGGQGTDIVVFAESFTRFSIVRTSNGYVVKDKLGIVGNDTLTSIERLRFSDEAIALDIEGIGGQAYRVYQAAFGRIPDASGLGYWIAQMDKGISLKEVASAFVGSSEFQTIYGKGASDSQIVSKFYENVLHRKGEAAGINYWVEVLNSKSATLGEVLAGFSESVENKDALFELIGNGFPYVPYG